MASLHYVRRWWHSVMMTRNFSMRKYSKRIFCRFLRLISVIVTLALKRQFFYINICCFIITVLSGQDWYHSITQPPKTSVRRKDLGDLLYMLPILCQISLPWQRGLIARPQQPPTRCKDLDDICYTNWVTVYFISNWSWRNLSDSIQ